MFRESAAYAARKRGATTWEYRLLSLADSVGDARWHVRNVFESRLDATKLGDVELVVSELVTNAVRHGPSGALITLRLATHADGAVSGEVIDQGNGVIAIRELEAGGEGGMGLPIVEALSSAWGVYPGRAHVWFRFDAD